MIRRFFAVSTFSGIAFMLAACGASSDAPVGGAPVVTPGGAADGNDIDALVAAAGNINTDKVADPAPVELRKLDPVTVQTKDAEFSCQRTEYSLTKVPEKFVALNPNADVLWPGSLVQGKSLAGGILDPVPIDRAPGTIVLTLASGGNNAFSRRMEKPSLAAAIQAQNDILSEYTGSTPAKFSYSYSEVQSMEQLSVAIEANVKGTSWAAAAALSFDDKDEKSRYLIQFTQEYFTMAYEPPAGAHAMFAPTVTAEDLAPYVGPGNPPVYISSVTYGRIFYIMFESTVSSKELASSIKAAFSVGQVSGDVGVGVDYKKVVNEATIRVYGLGGNAESAIAAATGYKLGDPSSQLTQQELIQKFLTTGANFDKNNPGVPISYTIRYLGDSSQVKLALTTEYVAKDCTPTGKCDNGTKTIDACGVCGGDGSSCAPCPQGTYKKTYDNGGFVIFNLPAGNSGDWKTFSDGYHTEYKFPTCRHFWWKGASFQCNAGKWRLDSNASFDWDATCHKGSSNDGAANGVSTGVE